MDTWLKILIGAACCVIIVAGGAYGWGEWSQNRQDKTATEQIERVRAELFRYAQAAPHEIDEVRDYCEDIHTWLRGAKDSDHKQVIQQLDRNCSILGYR
jgi:hypothetical protein